MTYVARRPLLFNGVHYRPGDVVRGFPEEAQRPEGFLRTGIIIEVSTPEPEEVKPAEDEPKTTAKKTAAKKA